MSDFLARLGGANLDVLRQVPSARSRFVQMALILFTTAGLAVVSMSFALHDGLRSPWAWAVPLGVMWGAIIFNIDRFLVQSLGSTRNKGQLVSMAIPRLAMAALLSLAISTPLVLRVFSSDIKAEVYTLQQKRSQQQLLQSPNTMEAKEAADVARQIAHDQDVIDGQLPGNVTSPALQQAQQQVAALTTQQQQAQSARDLAYEAWQCELYGAGVTCHNASNRQGAGPLAGAKEQEYQAAQAKLAQVTQELQQATSVEQADQRQVETNQAGVLAKAQRDAQLELPTLQRREAALQSYLQKTADQGTSVNRGDTGILIQLEALSKLSSQSGTLTAAHLLLMALFFLIEILPVSVKVLLNLQPLTAYEAVANAAEEEIIERVRSQSHELRLIEEGRSRNRLAKADDISRREAALTRQITDHLEAEMVRAIDSEVQKWRRDLPSYLSKPIHSTASNGSEAVSSTHATPGHSNGSPPDPVATNGTAVADPWSEWAAPASLTEHPTPAGSPAALNGSPTNVHVLRDQTPLRDTDAI
jgi:hypothetical protein